MVVKNHPAPSGSGYYTVEQYNGSSWTELNDLNTARKASWNIRFTQTAAISC